MSELSWRPTAYLSLDPWGRLTQKWEGYKTDSVIVPDYQNGTATRKVQEIVVRTEWRRIKERSPKD